MARQKARYLRRNLTEAERRLWSCLRRRQLFGRRFRRQAPIGPYIVDFVCFSKRLVVELDGGQHAVRVERDAARTCWLESQGFRVLRFWDHDVLANSGAVVESIWRALAEQSAEG